MDRVTFATASGAVWFTLAIHFAVGLVSIVSGTIALSSAKGGELHKQTGLVFTFAMVVLGLTATAIGLFEGEQGQAFGGLLATYLVMSALTTVKSLPRVGRSLNVTLMITGFAMAAIMLYGGAIEWMDPTIKVVGRPRVVPLLGMGTVILLASIGDLRAIRAGGLQGSRRLARHLWRMCFGLFVATGAFFLGQMSFIPQPLRNVQLLLVVAFSPLLILVYWMWRVRVRGRISGMVLGDTQSH